MLGMTGLRATILRGSTDGLCIWEVPSCWRARYSQIQSFWLETEAKPLGLEAKVLGHPGNRSFSAGDAASTTGSGAGDSAYPRKQTLLDRGNAGSNGLAAVLCFTLFFVGAWFSGFCCCCLFSDKRDKERAAEEGNDEDGH